MAANRTDIYKKTHKILKKNFKAELPNQRMPLLEQMVFACCLEDGSAGPAAAAFTALEEQFFDWNEVRVSTITELAEVLSMLPDPRVAAARLKQTLQSVFEANYSFDLEGFKKENIGATVKRLQGYDGVSPFCVAYVTQNALGGHAIPLGRGALEVLYIIGAIDEKEKAAYSAPGLERAIPKNSGPEFGSLVNQLGNEFLRSPFGTNVRKIILDIEPEAKQRFPKRAPKPEPPAATQATPQAAAPAKKKPAEPIKKTVTIKRKKKTAGPAPSQSKATKPPAVKKKVTKKLPTRRKPR